MNWNKIFALSLRHIYLIKGSLVVFSPLFFHFDETLKIFETLLLSKKVLIFFKEEHWICLLYTSDAADE